MKKVCLALLTMLTLGRGMLQSRRSQFWLPASLPTENLGYSVSTRSCSPSASWTRC